MNTQDYDENEKDNDNNSESETEERLDQAELIEKTGEVVPHNAKHLIHCLTVIGRWRGIMFCRPRIRLRNMNILFRRLWQLNRIAALRDW